MAIQSVEPNVADKINSELKSYKLDYKLEQESLNQEIDNALLEYASKGGGKGGNRPDAKLLLQDSSLNFYPILIEYKGYEDKLEKLDTDGNIENKTAKNEPNFKNIKEYAVNGGSTMQTPYFTIQAILTSSPLASLALKTTKANSKQKSESITSQSQI